MNGLAKNLLRLGFCIVLVSSLGLFIFPGAHLYCGAWSPQIEEQWRKKVRWEEFLTVVFAIFWVMGIIVSIAGALIHFIFKPSQN